jgi:hypothetical protein
LKREALIVVGPGLTISMRRGIIETHFSPFRWESSVTHRPIFLLAVFVLALHLTLTAQTVRVITVDAAIFPASAQFIHEGFRMNRGVLLEKERDPCLQALIPDAPHPVEVHRPEAWTRLPSDDNPVDARQVKIRHRPQQRFE